METSLTAEAGPHEEDAFPARPAYASILEKRLDALSDFERDIIERRFLVEDSETLDAIGASWGGGRRRWPRSGRPPPSAESSPLAGPTRTAKT